MSSMSRTVAARPTKPAAQSSRATPPAIGDVIAGYRLERVLGRGGMGVVYEATQLSLDRRIALKMLSPLIGDDPVLLARFRREALLQAALDHPHIVDVYEAGVAAEGMYIAMRLVRGETLKAKIRQQRLTFESALQMLAPVAEALDDAHSAGLVHRDVKPENVLVSVHNHAYLADFGLAHSRREPTLTDPGCLMGTPGYIAPELRCGDDATPASDVYAFSAMLLECLAATGATSPLLKRALARGLAFRPSDRPSRVAELIAEASRAVEPARRQPARLRRAAGVAERARRGRRITTRAVAALLATATVTAVLTRDTAGPPSGAAERSVTDLGRPIVTVMSRGEFLREQRLVAPDIDPAALQSRGAAVETELRIDYGVRDLEAVCSLRDLTGEQAIGLSRLHIRPVGNPSSVTITCWLPAQLADGHRYRAIVRVWAHGSGPGPIALGSVDFAARQR
jgi:protein kinase-like protein